LLINFVFLLALGIGIVAGLRSLLAPAVIAWAAHFDLLILHASPPKRTALAPLLARILLGALSGASLCAATGKSLLAGALLGGIGGVIGAFVGYEIRRRVVNNLHVKDTFVAICEDLVAIALAYFLVSR
jgi:uncharacterized membrane protein